MARKTARPGRTLVVFFIGVAIAYGLVALGGTWKPALGLDLQGGTRITLSAVGNPTAAQLDEARKIIDQRVNGSGVVEAAVTVQGNQYIQVEIPGDSRRDLVNTVERQAQLRFRLVACSSANPGACGAAAAPNPSGAPGATTSPGAGLTVAPPSASPSKQGTKGPKASPSGHNRAPVSFADKGNRANKGSGATKPSSSPSATPSASPSASPTSSPTAEPIPAPPGGDLVADPLKWMDNPNPEAIAAYNKFQCPADGSAPLVEDNPDKPLVTCGTGDQTGVKYLLSAAAVEGTDLKSASAGIPQGQLDWVVSVEIGGAGKDEFTKISRALYGTQKQFAIVLDGQVISAPTMNGLITDGRAQISGNFTEATANSLATSLKYGALPIAFDKDPTIDVIGPSLAGDQLSAGITAGIVGLLLVMLYCLIYYRGLGVVVIASLLVAAAVTYAMVLLLSKGAGFTLSLPGIAGLIVAVGITADSFIVFFERIRDEMRDGKSMRVAVEAGWLRARNTCLAADTVSLLAAVVLYIFAAGVVKGFAFALGLSTVIDLAVFFWFTHPMVSYLARYRFFNRGHKLSGLDPEALGIDRVTVGGRA
ncbi:MAG: protein-export rane protein SecD [Nocardioides sp.]|nr:protein-export rane protein SecD [Nocardioides sp.]